MLVQSWLCSHNEVEAWATANDTTRSAAFRRLVELGSEGEGEIGTMEKLVALTIVLVIVAFVAVYAIAALKGSSKGK